MVEINYIQVLIYGSVIWLIVDFILHLIWHTPSFIKKRRAKSKANVLGECTKSTFSDQSTPFEKLSYSVQPPEIKKYEKQKDIKSPKIKFETYN